MTSPGPLNKLGIWFYSLVAAAVGGVGTAVAAAITGQVVGATNFTLRQLGSIALGGAVSAIALYLKQSPLPKLNGSAVVTPLLILTLLGVPLVSGCATSTGSAPISTAAQAHQALDVSIDLYRVTMTAINHSHAAGIIPEPQYQSALVIARDYEAASQAALAAVHLFESSGDRRQFDAAYAKLGAAIIKLAATSAGGGK